MSSLASSRRGTKKYARGANRQKLFLTVDLNDPPPARPARAVWQSEGTSGSPEATTAETITSPIDLEAIEDDDVQFLSSTLGFSQARNQFGTCPVTVVLDEDSEPSSGASVIIVDDHLSAVPLNSFRRHRTLSPSRIVINCEAYGNVEDNHTAKVLPDFKRKKAPSHRIEPEIVVPKEPVFSCPICMSSLTDACSTICGHVFCQSCIKQALQSQKKCPTCRRKLTANNFHRVFLPTST